MARPVSAAHQQDPRGFEIQQIWRRYHPRETSGKNTGDRVLNFNLAPSDPDFPFELETLQCELTVPASYRIGDGRPSLRIRNANMPRGYQINVEEGFKRLAEQHNKQTLLGLMKELDRQLEAFLTTQKAQTITLVPNVRPEPQLRVIAVPQPPPAVKEPEIIVPKYSAEDTAAAKNLRDAQIRQLEARLGRDSRFSKSTNGEDYQVPLLIPKPGRLPSELQSINQVSLHVPKFYNLEPCAIALKGSMSSAARTVEVAFASYAQANPGLSLMAKLNHLTQNMHLLAEEKQEADPPPQEKAERPAVEDKPMLSTAVALSTEQQPSTDQKSHIQVIPRPPEWSNPRQEDDASSSSEYSDSDFSYDEGEEGGAQLQEEDRQPNIACSAPTAGSILLSFPNITLHNIELLEVATISVTIRCSRCKEITDFHNVQPHLTKAVSCRKCNIPITITFTPTPMHASSQRAGSLTLDPSATTIVDLLPSRFIPTCSSCSSPYTSTTLQILAVRGDHSSITCLTCHTRLNFSIPETKFLRLSSSSTPNTLPLRTRRPKENLGITANTPLPNRGTCPHYSKSYRWFRFSCCNKVYPCDRCHDAQSEPKHPNEHANRMICGWCSREQNYRPEDCGSCGRSVTKKTGGGFWEGGQGTRDRLKMRRKDTRKFKRIGSAAK